VTSGGPLRILIADDQALVRAGFKMILDAEDDLDVVGEAADGAAAVELARRLKPPGTKAAAHRRLARLQKLAER